MNDEPRVFDAMFNSWRSCTTGHRIITDGLEPIQTRHLPKRYWMPELIHRQLAKRFLPYGVGIKSFSVERPKTPE